MSTTERIKLPSGAWVQLRDAKTLRRGDKKKALKMVPVDENASMSLAMPHEMADGVLAVLVIDWSYPLPLPSESVESLDLLPIEDDEALKKAVAAAQKLLFPEMPDATDAKQRQDPASPTEPSAG